jgi:hypothetical protein
VPPNALTAVTVNVYVTPAVKPVTVIGLLKPVAIMLPGLEVTIYDVILRPPLLTGGVNETVADKEPCAEAVILVGESGRLEKLPTCTY